MADATPTRRDFLTVAGLTLLAGDSVDAADPPRDLKPSGADLGSLFPDVEKLAQTNRYSFALSGGRFRNFDDYRTAARDKVLELLLYRPEKVDPKAEVVERVERDDHIREKIVFSTGPACRVPAYVLLPKKLKGTAPAIVDLHSHGGMFLFGKEKVIDLGDNHPAMTAYQEHNYDGRPTATALVRRGYVVMSIDALGFGERRILLDADLKHGWDRAKYNEDDVKHLNQQCRAKEATLVKGLTLAGLTWPGIVCWDDMRTVDYLATRPEVDAKRIGCLGISMGGYRSLYLAALDERIVAACVTGFLSTVRPMIRGAPGYAFLGPLPAGIAPLPRPARRGIAGGAARPDGAAVRSRSALPAGRDEGGCREDRRSVRQGRREGEVLGPVLRRAAPVHAAHAG